MMRTGGARRRPITIISNEFIGRLFVPSLQLCFLRYSITRKPAKWMLRYKLEKVSHLKERANGGVSEF